MTRGIDRTVSQEDEYVWLGDLSGFTIEALTDVVVVNHRCGRSWERHGAQCYVANIIVDVVRPHAREGCS